MFRDWKEDALELLDGGDRMTMMMMMMTMGVRRNFFRAGENILEGI